MANFFKSLFGSSASDEDKSKTDGSAPTTDTDIKSTDTDTTSADADAKSADIDIKVTDTKVDTDTNAADTDTPSVVADTKTAADTEPEPVVVDVEPSDTTEPADTSVDTPAAAPVVADDTTTPDSTTPATDTDEPEPVATPAADEPAAEVKPNLDEPAIRLKTSVDIESEKGYVVGISIQGRGHIMSGTPCQDYHAFEDLGDGWLLAITSDGAGSAREAERGSKANCEMASKMIKKLIADRKWKSAASLPSDKEWYIEVKNVFELMQAIIMKNAAAQAADYKPTTEENRPLEPRDFNATIIVLLITPLGMMSAHIGDGRMGYLSQDGEWKTLMTPHKGDEASATVFIPNNWNRQLNVPAFTMSDAYLPDTCVVNERPKAFVLMSDGCESFSWMCMMYDKERNTYYDKNLPFDKFFNPLIEHLDKITDPEERVNELFDIINMGTDGGRREVDDRTMLFGVLAH